ncbi:MAG TPA: response regulator transcription factor [Gammaproteobacteria bacterium]|nr:response regulator transcription factor [Gammaproteobacteria bacterium]
MKLLIIEDSSRLRTSLVAGFTRLGCAIDCTGDGDEGLSYAMLNHYDVIILDLMLSGMDGLSVLKELRNQHRDDYVLILSAKDRVEDRVACLNAGADDYMTKPFSFDELYARLLTLTRRKYNTGSPRICFGDLVVDMMMRQVSINKVEPGLTPTEYQIIEYLALNTNQVISYGSLSEQMHSSQSAVTTRNTLEVHISSLRKKLKSAGITGLIKTKRGFGYYISDR